MKQRDAWYVPAESVYCILEVKPCLDASTIGYAAKKIASVRKLKRTSAKFVGEARVSPKRVLRPIVGGIVTLNCNWRRDGLALRKSLVGLSAHELLDIGCALQWGTFTTEKNPKKLDIQLSDHDEALIYFYLQLFTLLQKIGTVPAIDIGAYSINLHARSI